LEFLVQCVETLPDHLLSSPSPVTAMSCCDAWSISRLVREAWSFSTKLAPHIEAIKLCICHYNLTRAVAYSEHYMECTTENRGRLDVGRIVPLLPVVLEKIAPLLLGSQFVTHS